MTFCFYPKHEHNCLNVGHCPHLGGASLGSLVLVANENDEQHNWLWRQVNDLRAECDKKYGRIVELEKQLEQTKLELKLERPNKFATHQQKEEKGVSDDNATEEPSDEPKQRGAPVGHPGWFRPTPTEYDWVIPVPAPSRCPHCNGKVTVQASLPPVDHLQEEILDNVYRVVCYQQEAACCDDCGKCVSKAGKDELLDSRIGPYFWVHGDENYVHFQYDTSRAGQVSRDILGDDFTGTLVTDCYSGYAASVAGAKQKCLAHLARTARDWQKLTEKDSLDYAFFEDIKQFVKRGCEFHRLRTQGKLSDDEQSLEKSWLRAEQVRLETGFVEHEKAITLQARLLRHTLEWLVFLDDSRVPPTNNLAERALRPLVVLRKITFGSRSDAGAQRMAKLMTVGETARRHGHRASAIYFELYTRPPDHVMRRMYAGA